MGFPLTRRAFPCYTENVPDPIHKGNQIDLASKLWQASIGFQGPTHFRISYRLTLKIRPYSYRYEKRVILIIKMIHESYIIKMLGANKKNVGVELCESEHKLLGPSQVES